MTEKSTPLKPEWKPNAKAKEWTPTPAALAATGVTPSGQQQQPPPARAAEAEAVQEPNGDAADKPTANGTAAAAEAPAAEAPAAEAPVAEAPAAEAAAPADPPAADSEAPAAAAAPPAAAAAAAAPAAAEPAPPQLPDDATTKRLYDIARLLSMRPTDAQPPRPAALNPPPDLNILWDGSLDANGPSGSLSARSLGSAMSGGGSGFTTPRGDPGSRGQSGRTSFNVGDRGASSRGLTRQGSSGHVGGGARRDGGRGGGGGGGGRRPVDTAPALEDCEPLQVNEGTRWKAKHMLEEEEAAKLEAAAEDPEIIMRRAIALLNKMTLEKFDKLSAQFTDVGFTTVELVDRIISSLVEKAQMEAHFAPMYAKLCLRLSEAQLPAFRDAKNGPKMFRKMLLEHCQEEFGKDTADIIQGIKSDSSLTPEEQAERELIVKRRYTGHMRFVGELYKVGLLKEKYVHLSIEELLGMEEDGNVMPDEEKLECMVKLMSTVGAQMEQHPSSPDFVKNFKRYFKRIKKLSEDTEHVSSRLRFMLRDLVDLRSNDWVPRRAEEKAKTLAQIHNEVAREEEAKARKAGGDGRRHGSSVPSRPSSSGVGSGSQDVRSGGRSGYTPSAPAPVADDGWETVPAKGKRAGGAGAGFSAAPNKAAKPSASGKSSSATSKPPRGTAAQGSGFAALAAGDDKSSSKRSSSKHKESKSGSGKDKSSKKDKERSGDGKKASAAAAAAAAAEPEAEPELEAEARPDVSEEEARRVAKSAAEELSVAGDMAEALLCLRELQAPQHFWAMVSETVGQSLERKDKDRAAVLSLLKAAGAGGVGAPAGEGGFISQDDMARGCAAAVDFLSDLEIDVPMAGAHAAKMLGALVACGALPLSLLTPEFAAQNMSELIASGRAAKFGVQVLAETLSALDGDAEAFKALTAACSPPLDAEQLAQLLLEEDRGDDSGAAAVAQLLEKYSVTL